MNIISAQGEKNLTEFARRVYHISGGAGTIAERAAVAALARDNPHLRPDKPIEPGTPVIVPPLDGSAAATSTASPLDEVKRATAEMRTALDRVGRELASSLEQQVTIDEEMLTAVKTNAAGLRGGGEELLARAKEIQKATKQRIDAMATQNKDHRAAVNELGKELDAFLASL